MFESIFGGDLNGQCIYDIDSLDAEDNFPRGGNKRSSGFDGAKLIARFGKETGKAMMYDIFGINKQTGELELAAQEWFPLKWVRNAPPPKTWPERMQDFVVVSVPSWLYNKKSWPKTHDMQVIHLIFHPQSQI